MQRFAMALLAPDAKERAARLARKRVASLEPQARFVHGFTHFTLEASVWSLDLEQPSHAPAQGLLVTPEQRAQLALPSPISQLFVQLDSAGLFAPR
jgi:adenine-specific DNA glycosylase